MVGSPPPVAGDSSDGSLVGLLTVGADALGVGTDDWAVTPPPLFAPNNNAPISSAAKRVAARASHRKRFFSGGLSTGTSPKTCCSGSWGDGCSPSPLSAAGAMSPFCGSVTAGSTCLLAVLWGSLGADAALAWAVWWGSVAGRSSLPC